MAVAATYKGYRYPSEVIGHAVWPYHRFALSVRDVEELMLARGAMLNYETIGSWCAKFGPDYANQLRRRRPRPGDKWHVDEVLVKINGITHYLWRAVDQHGNVLDILVQYTTGTHERGPPVHENAQNRPIFGGTGNLPGYPWLYPSEQLGNGEDAIPSNPVVDVAHGGG